MRSTPATNSASTNGTSILVGDVGGTRTRFGIIDPKGELVREWDLEETHHSTLIDAVRDFLEEVDPRARPRQGAIAVACPVLADQVQMTNRQWSFSIAEVRRQLELEVLEVVNDFSALALALPGLGRQDTRTLNEGQRVADEPLALLGPGTGLGVSALIPCGDHWATLSTEGGHRSLAASNEREWAIVQRLRERFETVSAERALSGPGLVHLYEAICGLEGIVAEARTPEEVVRGAGEDGCKACRETVRVFARQLGCVAGDLALTLGSLGGLFIGGGVVPRMGEAFDTALFLEGFLDKGRFRSYVEQIPVRLIVRKQAALLGAAVALSSRLPIGVRDSGAVSPP